MTDKPFSYDDCKPHRDGKRRAVDRNGRVYVLLCDDAGGTWPIKGYLADQPDSCFAWFANGRLYALKSDSDDLVGPAPEPPREWYIVLHAGKPWTVAETQEITQQKLQSGSSTEYVRVVEARA